MSQRLPQADFTRGRPGRAVQGIGWSVLGLLLLALLVGAVTADRSTWPSLVGDEATYAMQAASLAFDGDLAYEREDYDRFLRHWGRPPDGLILQSRSAGAEITFSKAYLYALAVAPAVRFAPVRGPLVVNALLLALAALASAWVLERRVGPAAALWVAVACFASVAFAYTFWIHADLFLMCCTALGLALVYWGEPPAVVHSRMTDVYQPPRGVWESAGGWRPLPRWFLAGLLLAVPGAYRPLYLGLLLPAIFAARAEAVEDRSRVTPRLAALLLGAVILLGSTALVQWSAGGHWSAYGGERQGFYGYTGFPDVDFPRAEWFESVRRWGNTSWLHDEAMSRPVAYLDGGLLGWNTVYFLAGRNVGVLPYFLPVVLGLALFVPWRGRGWLLLAVVLAVAALFFLRPFNFYGGTGALANRYFLPLYPAFWFLAGRGPTPRDLAGWGRGAMAAAVALLAVPFLLPLWSAPRAFPIGDDARYRYVSSWAVRWLPYETTQSHVPGGRDKNVNGLWVKLLTGVELAPEGGEAGYVLLPEGFAGLPDTLGVDRGPARLLVGSGEPLESLYLEFGPGAPAELAVGGAELKRTVLSPDGGTGHLLELAGPRAVHPMWWTADDFHLYEITLARPETPARFHVEPGVQADIRPSGRTP